MSPDLEQRIISMRYQPTTVGNMIVDPEGSYASAEAVEILQRQLANAQKQNVELRDAFINARYALQLANDTPNGPICDTIWMMHSMETLFDFMDATIAQTKEEHQPVEQKLAEREKQNVMQLQQSMVI